MNGMHTSLAGSQRRLLSAIKTSPRSLAPSPSSDRRLLFSIPAESLTPLRTVRFAHSRSPTSQSPFRSPVVQTKHDIVLEFRSTLTCGSRWRKTEAVVQLLEKLAGEDGLYKSEMQLVVSQLQHDLFAKQELLPDAVLKRVQSAYVEAFVSKRIPYHVLADELISYARGTASSAEEKCVKYARDLEEAKSALAACDTERAALAQRLAEYSALPSPDEHCELRKQLETMETHLQAADDHIIRLKKKKANLRLMLRRREEVIQELVELKQALAKQVEDLSQAQIQRDIQLKRCNTQQKTVEMRYADAIAQYKLAASRITGLEQQLQHAQNECEALKERAAVAFDELTPRPDWLEAGVSQSSAEGRKSSRACFAEVLRLLHDRKSQSPNKRKTRKMLSPPPFKESQ